MVGIIIITHGNLAQELIETVKLIIGEQKDLVPITLSAKESIDGLRGRAAAAAEVFRTQGCLILTDLLGGSPTNVCIEMLKSDWIRVISGVNLSMVLAALQQRGTTDLNVVSAKVRDAAIKGIVDLKAFYEERAKKK